MRSLLVALTLLAGLTIPLRAQAPTSEPEAGAELRVWLMTAGPGDAVWERYGHNALRVLDTRTGYDVSYNWGIFSFAEPVQFIVRFLQGRMLYSMQPIDTRATLASYANQNREVTLQELDLTPAEKAELRDFAEVNARPENRDYYYQYFRDNCSTRVRDLLDRVLDGRLADRFDTEDAGTSFRFHTRRLTEVDPLIYTGMDALLGTPTDQRLTVWEEMFLPLVLRDEIRGLEIARADGSVRPLVLAEEVVVPSTRPPAPASPPGWLLRYLVLGLLFGGLFATLAFPNVRTRDAARRAVLGVAVLWSVLFGVLGTILVLLLFTDHVFSVWNENLFLANPILLGLAVALPLSGRPRWAARARWLASAAALLGVVGLVWQVVPWSSHQNAIFFALILPGLLGLAGGVRALSAAEPTPGTG